MKGDFVVKFIGAFIRTGKELHDIWQWQPLYYKGVRISGYSYSKDYSGLKNLERRGVIRGLSGDSYKFTKKGKEWFDKSLLRYHRFKGTKWDKKWRVVIFDIPEELHKNRNYFRNKLKNMGFYMLQKSIFVIPYSCEEELGHTCRNLKIGDYVDIIKADSIGFKEKEIRKYFGI